MALVSRRTLRLLMPACLRSGLVCFWVMLLTAVACPLQAQTVRVTNPGAGTALLDQPWRFHVGDDLHWADPAFDDSQWEVLRPDASWGAQGHRGYTGYAWYRLRVEVQGSGPALEIFLPAVDDNYEVFSDGVRIGGYGGFPPHAHLGNANPGTMFPLPALRGSASRVLAVRVWKTQLASNDPADLGGFEAAPVLGSAPVLNLLRSDGIANHDHRFVTREMLSAVVLAAGCVCLVLFFRGTGGAVFLWTAVYLIADASSALISTLFWYRMSFGGLQFVNAVRVTACNLALWLALLHLFGMAQMRVWRRLTLLLGVVMAAVEAIDLTVLLWWQFAHPALRWIDAVTTVAYTVLPAYMFVLLWSGIRRNERVNFWPLAVSVSAYGLYNILIDTSTQGQRFTGLHFAQTIDTWTFSLGGYPMGVRSCLDALFVVALLLTVAREEAATRERRNALETELKSAQEIQRAMVPDILPEVPGFAMEALYRPAQEVGGDFFQVLPMGEDGLLLVLGDVSGKGLKAAMTVSLIVGAIPTLAEVSASPGALLAGLNRRLVGRTAGGFATCLALRIDRDGSATVANAGHLSPFLGEDELPTEGAVPLGLVDGMTYAEVPFALTRGTQLTVYTDGLLEARSASGELFGFQRVAELLAR